MYSSKPTCGGSDLRKADLFNADFRNADMSGADLRGADCTSVDFSGTDLTSANLSSLELGPGKRISTKIKNANFRGCNMANATVPNYLQRYLAGAINIENINWVPR